MSAPRIPAIGPVLPGRPAGATAREDGTPPRLPAQGETLRLTLNAADGTWSATSQEGQPVRLAATLLEHEGLGADLSPGDVLMVKVLATSPRIELARLGPAPASVSAQATHSTAFLGTGGPPPAMRPDQVAISRMNWAPPDAEALAVHWQVSVLALIRKALGGRPTDSGWPALTQAASQVGLPPMERWLFPAHAWAGLPLALHLLPPGRPRAFRTRAPRRSGWGLRVAGLLPGIGRVEVQTQMAGDCVELTILAEDDAVLRLLRDASALIGDAVTRSGQRLLGCHWMTQLPAEEAEGSSALTTATEASPPPLQAWPPGGLFRTGAEVLVALGTVGAASARGASAHAGTSASPGA